MSRNIVCLKWGDKYHPHYVNVLYRMCKRHNLSPFNFICLTENSQGLDKDIIVKPLPQSQLHGWWYKPYVFSKDLNLQGDVLFLDLDIVICANLEKLWEYHPNDFLIIRDFTRHMNPNWVKFNSSVFRFKAQNFHWIWENFTTNQNRILSKNFGDQDYLFNILKDSAKHWPDEWIQSYKWEIRSKGDLALINGKRNFISIKTPVVSPDCCITVFHGDPKPVEVNDPWVKDNWK